MQDIEKVFEQHEESIAQAHKAVLKESIDKEMPLAARVSFIYQNVDEKYYMSTTVVSSIFLQQHNTYTTHEQSEEVELTLDQFLDHLNHFNHENKRASTQAKRKRGRPRTKTPK